MSHKQNHDALESARENEERFEEELEKETAKKDKNTILASDIEEDEGNDED